MKSVVSILFALLFVYISVHPVNAQTQDESILSFMPAILAATNNSVSDNSVTGYWNVFHTTTGGTEEGPEPIKLVENNGKISGQGECGKSYTISGQRVDQQITLAIPADNVTLTGSISGNEMSGSGRWTESGSNVTGTWRSLKINELDCNSGIGSSYEVWGGSTYISGTEGYNPGNYGYTLLGSNTSTHTFAGAYNYYMIVVRNGNVAQVDTVQGSNGSYFPTYTTGNTIDWQNVGGAPDNKYAIVGGLYNGDGGGYILIQASGLSSVTVLIKP